jgi:hypothetical protein
MKSEINNIKINDLFWIKFGNGFISFGYKGLPSDMHFTVSMSDKSDDYNIHLTRNIGTDPKNKPKIEIVRINKNILEKVAPYSILSIIYKFLKPIDISAIITNAKEEAFFISMESLQNGPDAQEIESHIIETIRPISKVKSKGRFRIQGELEGAFENVLRNDQVLSAILDSQTEFKDAIGTSTKGGMLMYKQEAIAVLQINGQWFEFMPEVNPIEILASIVGREWAKVISEHTNISLSRIKDATNFDETKKWNTPIVLVANPELERLINVPEPPTG